MTDRKKLPIGIDIFEKLDRSEFYYIDKTGMIEELLQNRSEVNLFTPKAFRQIPEYEHVEDLL